MCRDGGDSRVCGRIEETIRLESQDGARLEAFSATSRCQLYFVGNEEPNSIFEDDLEICPIGQLNEE